MEGAAALMRGKNNEKRSRDDLLLGQADGLYRRGQKENIYLSSEERLQHYIILGATKGGKSKFIESQARQDILSGRGFCLIDPHGDLFHNILNFIAGLLNVGNRKRIEQYISKKLVLIDPTDTKWSVGFNPIEAVGIDPYTLVSEFMGIFKKFWREAHWGSRMEETLKNDLTSLSLKNLTILESKALLIDPAFRARLIKSLPEGEVKEYWLYRYNPLSERMQAVYREPIMNRLSLFLSNPSLRLIVGQTKSTIDFRSIMDESKWLLVNLSRNWLKSSASLLGSFLISKIQLAAFSRVDVSESKRTPFFLYVDEFQNFIGDDFNFTEAVSQLRKFGLSLTMANQHLNQLGRKLRASILANALTHIYFRLSHSDASVLSKEFGQRERPMIQRRLVNLKTREAYLKIKGKPARLMRTFYVPDTKNDPAAVQELKELVMPGCARPRQEVEQEIADRTALLSGTAGRRPPAFKNDPDTGRFAPLENFREGHDW
jgi:hypothetical protein